MRTLLQYSPANKCRG
ncbi:MULTISPECIES: IncL/M-type plasmid replication leader peptide RepB, partial [Enterobacterales]